MPRLTIERAIAEDLILANRERNGYHDSDFYVVAWDPEERCCTSIEIGSTRYGGGMSYAPETKREDIKELARKWYRRKQLEAIRRNWISFPDKRVVKGKYVRVILGRSKSAPIGMEGIIVWRGANQFRTYYKNGYNDPDSIFNQRIGIKDTEGKVHYCDLMCGPDLRVEILNEVMKPMTWRYSVRGHVNGYCTMFANPHDAIF